MISAVSNAALVSICRAAGTPKDKLAGIRIYRKIGGYVSRGKVMYTIYSEKKEKMQKAVRLAHPDAFRIVSRKSRDMLIERISR